MKIINFSDYNEKLKINSMSLNDFNKIDLLSINKIYTEYQKDNLKTGDVCQIVKDNKIGVIILSKDGIDLNLFELYNFVGNDILMLCNSGKNRIWTSLFLNDYNEQLKDSTNMHEYDIMKVMPSVIDLETFDHPDELEKQLKKYKEIFK